MRYKRFNWLAAAVLLWFMSCTPEEEPLVIPDHVDTYPISPLDAESFSLNELTAGYSFISLDLPAPHEFTGIRKAIFRDSNIYFLDISSTGSDPKIYAFDTSGTYLFDINKPGRGPGEYEYIHDFDVTEDRIILSTPAHILYYDRWTGAHVQTIDNSFDDNRMFGIYFFNNETGVTEAGRTRGNRSMNHLKFFDTSANSVFFEAVPFPSHALLLTSSYRHLFETGDGLRARPQNSGLVYRIEKASREEIAVEPEYYLDFGDLWIPESFLRTSFQNMDRIFSENLADDYVHTPDIFETDDVLYVTYSYQADRYVYLYDKRNGSFVNVSEISENSIGWPMEPIGVWNDQIAGIVYPFELTSDDTETDAALHQLITHSNDEGSPVLVLVNFSLGE